MTETTPGRAETGVQEPNGWVMLALFVLPMVNFFVLSHAGQHWLSQILPLMPEKRQAAPFALILGGAISLLFNARPATASDWGRIVLFFLILDVGGLLLLMAGEAFARHTGLDPWDGYGFIVGFPVGLAFLYLLSDFLMRRGLVPGCPSWREVRRRQQAVRQPYSEHYRPRHWLAGLVAGLVVAGLAWPLLAWLGDVALIYVLDPLAVPPLAMGAGLFAGLAMAFSRPPDGGTWGRSLLAALLAALLFPAFHVGLDQAIYVWVPPADPEEARRFAGVLISILAAFIPPLAMVGVAALRLGGLPAGPDAKPDGEATPAATRPKRWKPLTFDHAAAAAILFVGVWAGVYGLLEYIWSVRPVPAFPSIAALVMGVAAGALPLVARPSGSRGWVAASAALLAILAAMPAALATLVYAIRAWFSPLPDIHTILAVTHFGPLLPAAAIIFAAAWVLGRNRPVEGNPE